MIEWRKVWLILIGAACVVVGFFLAKCTHAATFTYTDDRCTSFTLNAAGALICNTTTVPPDQPPPQQNPFENCTTQGFSVVQPQQAITWGSAGQWTTAGPNPGQVWVFTLAVPAGVQPTATPGNVQAAEYGGGGVMRQLALAAKPCDFATPMAQSNGTSTRLYYGVGMGNPPMQAGHTYYVSVRNWSVDWNTWSCNPGSCGSSVLSAAPPM